LFTWSSKVSITRWLELVVEGNLGNKLCLLFTPLTLSFPVGMLNLDTIEERFLIGDSHLKRLKPFKNIGEAICLLGDWGEEEHVDSLLLLFDL
jgi:hypothetical protein